MFTETSDLRPKRSHITEKCLFCAQVSSCGHFQKSAVHIPLPQALLCTLANYLGFVSYPGYLFLIIHVCSVSNIRTYIGGKRCERPVMHKRIFTRLYINYCSLWNEFYGTDKKLNEYKPKTLPNDYLLLEHMQTWKQQCRVKRIH